MSPRPRRPRSKSLCNDHTETVVTEVPRRPGQPRSVPGIDYRAECAANDFAADLLVSRRLVTAASESTPTTTGLATTFEVSEIAMGYHLVNLGLRRKRLQTRAYLARGVAEGPSPRPRGRPARRALPVRPARPPRTRTATAPLSGRRAPARAPQLRGRRRPGAARAPARATRLLGHPLPRGRRARAHRLRPTRAR